MPIATDVTTSAPRQLSDGNSAGTILGQSSNDSISFYNQTPTPQILQGSLAGYNGLLRIYTTSQSPASIAPNTTQEVSMTVSGIAATDIIVALIKPTAQAGFAVGTARASTTNTIGASFGNVSATTVTPTTTESYVVVAAQASLGWTQTISPASVAAASVSEQQFNATQVQAGMVVAVNKPTVQAGLLVTGARAVANGIVAIEFMNVTTNTVITPTASETYSFFAARGLRLQPVMERMQVSLAPSSVAANTTAEQTFTVTGLLASTAVEVNKPSVTTGIALVNARVSAANTLALTYANVTAAAITPPTETYTIGYYPNVSPSAGSSNTQLASMGIAAERALSIMGLVSSDAF